MNCKCPGCMAERMRSGPATQAERLIDLADSVMFPKTQLISMDGLGCTDLALNRINIALTFSRMPAQLRFRAITENWDHARIMREMY